MKLSSILCNKLVDCFLSRADFFEDEAVEQILKYNPWWTDIYSKMMASLGKSQEQENHAALGKQLKIRLICFPSSLLLSTQL